MKLTPVKTFLSSLLLILSLTIAHASPAQADPNISGTYSADIFVGGNLVSSQTWYFVQQDTFIGGFGLTGTQTYLWSGYGEVNGTLLALTEIDVNSGLTAEYSGTVADDGSTISGSFTDTVLGAGTFEAKRTKITQNLTPRTQLVVPPIVIVQDHAATLTLAKFGKITTAVRRLLARATFVTGKRATTRSIYSLKYKVTLHSLLNPSDVRRVTSKKNIVNFKNLPAGTYAASYKVVAFRDDIKVFTTNESPAASFTVEQ